MFPQQLEELTFTEYALLLKGYIHKRKRETQEEAIYFKRLSYFVFMLVSPHIKKNQLDERGRPFGTESIYNKLGFPIPDELQEEEKNQKKQEEENLLRQFPKLKEVRK